MFIQMKFGELVETFTNGCLVIGHGPEGCEVAITGPNQSFPTRSIMGENGEKWLGSYAEAKAKAEACVRHLLCEYGTTLPDHLAVGE
jgi:hypothetical protein